MGMGAAGGLGGGRTERWRADAAASDRERRESGGGEIDDVGEFIMKTSED